VSVSFASKLFLKIKGKFHLITDHKCIEEEYKYIYSLSLTSALDGGGVNATPCRFTPRTAPVPIVEKDGQGPVPKWRGVEKRNPLSVAEVKVIGRKVKHFATKIRRNFTSLMSAGGTVGPDAKWRLLTILSRDVLHVSHNKMAS